MENVRLLQGSTCNYFTSCSCHLSSSEHVRLSLSLSYSVLISWFWPLFLFVQCFCFVSSPRHTEPQSRMWMATATPFFQTVKHFIIEILATGVEIGLWKEAEVISLPLFFLSASTVAECETNLMMHAQSSR